MVVWGPFSPWRGSCSCGPPIRFLLFWGGFDLVVLSLLSFVLVSLPRSVSVFALWVLGAVGVRLSLLCLLVFFLLLFCSLVWLGRCVCGLLVVCLSAPPLSVFASLPPAARPV